MMRRERKKGIRGDVRGWSDVKVGMKLRWVDMYVCIYVCMYAQVEITCIICQDSCLDCMYASYEWMRSEKWKVKSEKYVLAREQW
jgi:hypothetical protein